MKTVYKFQLGSSTLLELPRAAKVVHVENFFVWIELNPEAEKNTVMNFEIFGTGHTIPDEACHFGTFLEGAFVWHLYVTEVKK
jgi:hypothetical protein